MNEELQKQVISTATEILKENPDGLRTGELGQFIRQKMNYRRHGVHRALLTYVRGPNPKIYQPARGWFRHQKFKTLDISDQRSPGPGSEKLTEQAFYKPFAKWLEDGPESCSNAISLGGNILGDRFGTPDVIGVFKPRFGDVFQFHPELTAAEIKITTDLMTAFGQACSYKLFCHKSYIVIPEDPSPDLERLESLCYLLGIGLVTFNAQSLENPNFRVRTRAMRHEPDMFYVNEKLGRIAKQLLEPAKGPTL